MSRKDRFFFEKFLVSSGSFNADPNLTINIIDNESLLFINEGTGAVEISFDGTEVHSELNPASGTNSLIANYPSVNKIWFRLKSGAASVVRVQNDASIASSTTVNLRGGAKGTTVAADVTSENVDANTQALHVYVKGSNTDTNYPLALDGYGALDAFGRFRVSTPYTIFESKQLFDSDSQAIAWDTQLTSGGTSTYSQNRASSTLNVTSTVGSKVTRQTRARFNYQAGKSLLILSTFVMGTSVSGISKKCGYFDDKNGIYFHNNGAANSLVIRSYVTGAPIENEVFQGDWNIDTLDGSGPSGVTLDVSKAQIFFTDIEWLGVGSVRCGFIIDGISYYVHKFNHSNIINSVYMSTPNLPLRFQIENLSSGTGSSLEQICCSIISEGGYENQGFSFSTDRGVTPLTNVNNSNLYPVLSLRLASDRFGTQFLPQFIDAFCTTSNANFKWALIVNPTINGVDTASWNPIIGSAIEYDISRTVSNFVTGGYVITSGYDSQRAATNGSVIQGTFAFGSTIAGVSDQLVLAVRKLGGGTDSFVGSISWKEFT